MIYTVELENLTVAYVEASTLEIGETIEARHRAANGCIITTKAKIIDILEAREPWQ